MAAWRTSLGADADRIKEIAYRRVEDGLYFELRGLGPKPTLLSAASPSNPVVR